MKQKLALHKINSSSVVFFLDDAPGWGHIRIENALRKLVRYHNWMAACWDESRYLIEAPSPTWLEDTLNRGSVRLDNVILRVSPWDPCYAEGLRMIPCWVRIRGFSCKFWQWEDFEMVFSDFGATVLELDPGTFFKSERRFARLKLGVCDPMLLLATHWVLHRDPGGYLSRFDLIIELEHERNSGPSSWVRKTATVNPPKKPLNKPKGVKIDDSTAPAAPKRTTSNAPAGKGKGVVAQDNDETDSINLEYEFDVQGHKLSHWTKMGSRAEGSSQVSPVILQVEPSVSARAGADMGAEASRPTLGSPLRKDVQPPDSVPIPGATGTQRQRQVATQDVFSAMIEPMSTQPKLYQADQSHITQVDVHFPAANTLKHSLTVSATPLQLEELASKRRKGGTLRKHNSSGVAIPR
ncbi:hypothetical protein FCM35_KLT11606 [Carex littledalei]|uniref:DUF4283 domain-containing protein n=1 Tax=Carex littledalei TaxID=544730 RepID=A0A833QRI8_9POAL|nr:hypothetical protein FCM35_KLT11606 [Carex littledalei]